MEQNKPETCWVLQVETSLWSMNSGHWIFTKWTCVLFPLFTHQPPPQRYPHPFLKKPEAVRSLNTVHVCWTGTLTWTLKPSLNLWNFDTFKLRFDWTIATVRITVPVVADGRVLLSVISSTEPGARVTTSSRPHRCSVDTLTLPDSESTL